MHHLQYRFLKISGAGPPDPPSKARLASLDGPPSVPRKLLSGLTCMYFRCKKTWLSTLETVYHLWTLVAQWLERRFEICASSFTPYCLLSGIYAMGSKISHTGGKCIKSNLSWTPHSSQEKDNSLNHSCVSPSMGCLEYT